MLPHDLHQCRACCAVDADRGRVSQRAWLFEGVSNWANGVELEPGDEGYRTYWITEIEAPAGYELLANPIEVVVDSDSAGTETVVNVPKNGGFELPITGGAGSTAFVLGGLLLAVAGGVLLVVRKRQTV